MPGAPLSAEQLRAFQRDGALVLRGLLEPGVIEGWRSQFWGSVELAAAGHAVSGTGTASDDERAAVQQGDRSTWPTQQGRLPNITSLSPELCDLEPVRAVVEQVAALGGWELAGGSMAVRAPYYSHAAVAFSVTFLGGFGENDGGRPCGFWAGFQ